MERWKTVETLFLFCLCSPQRVKKNVKRRKCTHTSYIVHNSVDSEDSWQKWRALGAFSFCCVLQNSDFLPLHQYGKICDLLRNLLQKNVGYVSQNIAPKLSLSTLSAKKLFGLHQGNSEPNSANVLSIYFAYFSCFLERSIRVCLVTAASVNRRCCFICFLQKVGGIQGFKNGLIYWIY